MEIKRVALMMAEVHGAEVHGAEVHGAEVHGEARFVKPSDLALLHAEQISSELLDAVIAAADAPLILSKLEGNAAFLYAVAGDDETAIARQVARRAESIFAAFDAKAQALAGRIHCQCEACRQIGALRLKAVLHLGEAAFKRIKQFEELAGEDVILVHRLLHSPLGAGAYILMTEKFYQRSGGLAGQRAEARLEAVESFEPVRVHVYRALSPE